VSERRYFSPAMAVPCQGAEAPSTREGPCGADRVQSAEVPTKVKEVVARFVLVGIYRSLFSSCRMKNARSNIKIRGQLALFPWKSRRYEASA
jgi:hypothetical protein